jgi:hypothetical protein
MQQTLKSLCSRHLGSCCVVATSIYSDFDFSFKCDELA